MQHENEGLEEGDDGFPLGSSTTPPAQRKAEPSRRHQGNAQNAPKPVLDAPKGESAFSLVERDLPEPLRLCDPWVTEGVSIIAGRPKLGKTTLERQKLAAAVTGDAFFDSKFSKPCLCAFLSLEEGELLCRMKFKNAGFADEALAGIELFFQWGRGIDGVVMLDRYLDENPDVQFVVIDSLTKFRVVPDSRTPPFMADYEAVSMLHECSKRHPGVCIDIIHHTRKARSEDPIDDISGTYGLTAACDTYSVMRHSSEGAVLHVGGRLWTRNDNQYVLKRGAEGPPRWELIGVNLGLPQEQIDTLNIIKARPDGIGGTELGDKLGITKQSAWQRIDILLEKGFIVKRHNRAYLKGSVP